MGAILDNETAPATSGALGVGARKEEARPRKLLCKRRRVCSPIQAATYEESFTARSRRRPAPLRMDPRQSNGAMMNPSGYAPEGFQQAEIPEASVHHSEAYVEEVPAPTAKTRSKKSGTRIKLGNFNPDEDKNLVKSWLEISCDPITSNGQKEDRMWERIIGRYNSRRASDPARSLKSLQCRWVRIRAEVTLFASYYADSIRENPSGMSDADKTTHAVGNFADVEQRKFGFLHCWELMKDAPKWKDPSARDIAAAARGEGFGEESTAGTDTVDHAEGQSSPVRSGAQARRPMGRDSAKAVKKKAKCDAYVEEVPAPTAKTRSKKSGTRTKLGNFNPDEDKNLVKSWLEISCDPITSTGQKEDRMWERIIGRYNSRRASNPARSLKSLQCRWVRIRAEVTLFASYYADSIRENPSGMSDADKTTNAVGNFADVEQRKFGFLHCWELMKDAPKWQDPSARDIAAAARGEGFGEESTAGTDTVDHAEGKSCPVRSGAQARSPMGRDAAKAVKKKAKFDAGSTSSAEKVSPTPGSACCSSEEPTTARMDPRQSNVGEGSQGQFPGGNICAYHPGWNPYMYGYQGPPGWLPYGFQPRPPNVAMMNPSGYAPEGFQQAEMPEASVHHEAYVEEVPAPTAKTMSKKPGTRTKLGNFNPDEDKNLVKSWLEISCDPITSTGQKRDRMWERIIGRYNSRRASNPARSLRSLQSRWDRIRAEVTLFASYYADSIRENPSGMSDADKTTYAVDNFAAVLQHKFGFLHCWELMKDAPEWQVPNARDIATATPGEGFGEESTAGTDTADHAESSPVRSQRFQQAEIPEAYVHDSEADLEEVPKTRTKKSVTRTKLSNFNPDEDKNLVKSWLEISCDPITSTGQKRDRMWERIIERYNSMRASNPARSLRSLQSRWDRIRAEVTLFASYYADSIRENPSGISDADKTTYAVDNFAAVLQRKFGFLHCWELMKDAPEWQDPNARDIATAAPGEGFGEESTAGTDTVDHAESSPVRSGAQARRPMGRDSAKSAKKKANSDAGSTSSAEYAAGMQDLSLQRISVMQEEAVRKNDRFQQLASIDEKRYEEMRRHNEALIQIEWEKIRLMRAKQDDERLKEEKKEDERILKIDLDACTPSLRLYYQTRQEEILEKIAARRQRSQAP